MLNKGDCEGCDEKPTIFLTQIVNGELRTYNLCQDCPHMDEVNDPAGCALAEMLLKLSTNPSVAAPQSGPEDEGEFVEDPLEALDEVEAQGGDYADELAAGAAPAASKRQCGCGMSLRDFEQSQRLGCPKCYDTFQENLMNTLKTSQTRGASHRGKTPRDLQEFALRREGLDRELEMAVHAENFERAAQIRDLMRQLDHSSPRNGK